MNRTTQKDGTGMRLLHHATNEKGSVLAITMLVMVMLTLIGIASMTTSTIEEMIAGNERSYKENFFRAEAANMAGGQRYDNLADSSGGTGTGMTFGDAGPGVSEASKLALKGGVDWVSSTSLPDDPLTVAFIWDIALDNNSLYTIVYQGLPEGASEDLGSSDNLRKFAVYGQSSIKGGNVFIQTNGSVSF